MAMALYIIIQSLEFISGSGITITPMPVIIMCTEARKGTVTIEVPMDEITVVIKGIITVIMIIEFIMVETIIMIPGLKKSTGRKEIMMVITGSMIKTINIIIMGVGMGDSAYEYHRWRHGVDQLRKY